MGRQTPLIYFYGLVPGQYAVVWPVYVVGDNPGSLSFTVAVDSHDVALEKIADGASLAGEGRRQYVTQVTQRRLHQEGFRLRVLKAYSDCCAVCHLRHEELLDAAHILPDGHPKGEPIVPNGLALCKLHHAGVRGRRADAAPRAAGVRWGSDPCAAGGWTAAGRGFPGRAVRIVQEGGVEALRAAQ